MKRNYWFFMLILLLTAGCKIRDFALPAWDVDLAIPLMNEKYYISEILDTINIVTDQNDLIHLINSGHLETREIFSVKMNPGIDETLPIISGPAWQGQIPMQDSEGEIYLSYGEIKSGSIQYQFRGISPALNQATFILPDITHPNGNPLQISIQDLEQHTINLMGYSVGDYDSQQSLDYLRVELISNSDAPDGTLLGHMQIKLSDDIHFSLFKGMLTNFQIRADVGSSSIDVDYPFGIEHAISIQEATVKIDLINQLHFSCKFNGSLRASRDEQEVFIPILDDAGEPYIIPAATETEYGRISFILHDNISELLQILPKRVDIYNPRFTIDASSGFGCLSDDQIISAEYMVDAPFRFELFEHPFEINELMEISVPEENRDTIRKNLMDAKFRILAQNKLPLGARACIYFSHSPEIDINSPDTYSFMKSIMIKSNTEDPGWQDMPELNLSRDELLLFTEENVYLKWAFSFLASEGVVEVHASTADYVALKGSLWAKVRVEK